MKLKRTTLSLYLLLVLGFWLLAARAQESSTPDAARRTVLVTAVDAVGMTVADMDRSIEFYTQIRG